ELGDRPGGAGVELLLQIVEVVAGAARGGVGLGIGGDADLEIGDPLQPGDQVGGIGIAIGVRHVAAGRARAADRCTGRIAAQCDDVAAPGLPVVACVRVDLLGR